MIVTLTGPSASGKSTALKYFCTVVYAGWRPVVIPKYVTRRRRADDGQEVLHVQEIPSCCDLVYEQYGTRYGLEYKSIHEALIAESNPIVIVNDVRVVEDLRSAFGPVVRSIFIFREGPRLESFQRLSAARRVSGDSESIARFQKAQAIFRVYIENITLFDHVILNVGERSLLRRQVVTVVKGIVNTAPRRKRLSS